MENYFFEIFSAYDELLGENFSYKLKYLDSREGQKLFKGSFYSKEYELLNYYFEKQEEKQYCGIASATIVLNVLFAQKVEKPKYDENSTFTQSKLFNDSMWQNWFTRIVFLGLSLEELNNLLKYYGLVTKFYYAANISIDELRHIVRSSLNQKNTYIIANFPIDKYGIRGHFSPIGAYNLAEDSLLILDVSQDRPSYWIQTQILYSAMAKCNIFSRKSRGIIVATK